MQKKQKIIAGGVLSLTLLLGLTTKVLPASNVQPGSAQDPLVTKSYVDDKLSQSATKVDQQAIVDDVMAQIEFLYGDTLSGNNTGSNTTATPGQEAAQTYVPVSAKAGQIIVGHEGTEIILRSGTAVGYCPGANGLVNVTQGSELGNGDAVKLNNLLIVPRHDGRGVSVKTDAWFIIKGGYNIY